MIVVFIVVGLTDVHPCRVVFTKIQQNMLTQSPQCVFLEWGPRVSLKKVHAGRTTMPIRISAFDWSH